MPGDAASSGAPSWPRAGAPETLAGGSAGYAAARGRGTGPVPVSGEAQLPGHRPDIDKELVMTTASSPQGLPLAVPFAAGQVEDEQDTRETGPTVGSSDADADAAASGADVSLGDAARDSDGVPVGEADAEADKRASGA